MLNDSQTIVLFLSGLEAVCEYWYPFERKNNKKMKTRLDRFFNTNQHRGITFFKDLFNGTPYSVKFISPELLDIDISDSLDDF